MRIKPFALLCAVFFFLAAGETDAQGTAKTDEWRGLTLGVSSTADAIERLGNPTSDKLGQRYRPLMFEEWFDVEAEDFRVLHYKGA